MRDKHRALEWAKNAAIALLTLSAIVLLSMTPLVRDSGLVELLGPRPAQTGAGAGQTQSGPILPARLAVCRDGDRFGLQYDDSRMDEVFAAFVPLLGDALTGAGEPASLSDSQWRACLRQRGAYFDFSGEIPLAALARWLGGRGLPPQGQRPPGGSGGPRGGRRVPLLGGRWGRRLFYLPHCPVLLSPPGSGGGGRHPQRRLLRL